MAGRGSRVVAALPTGALLDDQRWRRQHRLLLAVLVAHLPVLAAIGAWAGAGLAPLLVGLAAAAAAAAGGLTLPGRVARSMSAAAGLVVTSAVLVHVADGLPLAHLHVLAVLTLVALYHDWRPYALALALVVLGHGSAGLLTPQVVYGGQAAGDQPWLWVLGHLAAVAVVAAAHVGFWQLAGTPHRQAETFYRQLYEGERAIVTRLRELEEVKNQLIAVVSHEFRTPLTGVLGYARTMQAHLDDMDPATVREFLHYIERQGARLSGLVDNLVAAADAGDSSAPAAANLRRVVARVGLDLDQHTGTSARRLALEVPGDLEVPMSTEATHLVLFNLLDNAVKFGAPDTAVRVEAHQEEGQVVMEVANCGGPIPPPLRERMFEPFVQGDSSDSRQAEGMGLGLHVVRQVVESHGGSVDLCDEAGAVTVRIRLPQRSISLPVDEPA